MADRHPPTDAEGNPLDAEQIAVLNELHTTNPTFDQIWALFLKRLENWVLITSEANNATKD